MKVLSFGEVLLDDIEGVQFLGGAPVNFAVNCENLGLNAQLYSAVGSDENGERIRQALRRHGLGLEFVAELKGIKSGLVDVKMDGGEPTYNIQENVAYDFIESLAFETELADQDFDLFYFGTLVQRRPQSRNALQRILRKGRFKERFFDCNLRQEFYDSETLRASLKAATIFKANQSELEVIMALLYGTQDCPIEKACNMLSADFSVPTMVITAGAEGAYLFRSKTLKFIPSVPVQLVDAVGAGDAFSAAFACNYISGIDPEEAVLRAHKLGGIVAQQQGAIPPISDQLREEIGF